MKPWSSLAVAALVTVGAGMAQAAEQGADLDAARAAARAKRLPALVELATWCSEQKLYRSRNELAAEIIVLDPSHSAARKWLRHRLGPGGEWEPPARKPPASDRNDEALAQLPAIRTKLFAGTAAELHAVLRDLGDAVSPGQREVVLAEIIDIAPGIRRYREEHQEVPTPDGWRLRETVRGAGRRAEIGRAVQSALGDAPDARLARLPSIAERSGLRWKGAWRAGDVTVTAMTDEDEAREVARGCNAVPAYLRVVMGEEFHLVPALSIYLMESKDEMERLVAADPNIGPRTHEHYRKFAGMWLRDGGSDFTVYTPTRAWRVESSVGQQIAGCLAQKYKLYGKQPWVRQGFRLRLTHDIVRTRIVSTKRLSEYGKPAEDWAPRAGAEDAGWYERAGVLLAKMGPADLAEVLGRPLNRLTLDDYVVCNAIAAYYVEGRPGESAVLLGKIGEGLGPADALRAASGLDIEALHLRLMRWLEERE